MTYAATPQALCTVVCLYRVVLVHPLFRPLTYMYNNLVYVLAPLYCMDDCAGEKQVKLVYLFEYLSKGWMNIRVLLLHFGRNC